MPAFNFDFQGHFNISSRDFKDADARRRLLEVLMVQKIEEIIGASETYDLVTHDVYAEDPTPLAEDPVYLAPEV